MPTYEYVCKNCGDTIEVFQSFSDKPLKRHDACGGDLKKVFHARGIVFKGGGFYATDNKAGSSSSSSEPEKSKPTKKSGEKSGEKAAASSPSSSSSTSPEGA